MATMRKLSSLAALRRAVNGGGAAVSTATATRHRFLQPSLYHTGSNFSSQSSKSQYNFSGDLHDAGHKQLSAMTATRYFSAAAASPSASVAFAEKELPEEAINERFVPKEVVLYQYEACPFCNKVKAFLDYYDIRYKIVEVNPINKKEIKWSDYKKVPILLVDGEQMVNSSDIIDNLSQRMHLDKSLGSITDNDEVQKWRRWVDDDLVHVLSPNIYRTASEALESFDYITSHGNFSFTERLVAKYAGATAMYFVSKKLKKKYNITDERRSLYAAAEAWVDALQGREFLGGSEPTLADLAVFGVLRPIRYLKSGKDMVENTRIGDWYTRMETEMQRHRDLKPQAD